MNVAERSHGRETSILLGTCRASKQTTPRGCYEGCVTAYLAQHPVEPTLP